MKPCHVNVTMSYLYVNQVTDDKRLLNMIPVILKGIIRHIWVWGSVVVKALRYYSDGPGIDSRWCH